MCTIVGRSAGRDRNRGDNLTFGMFAEATQSMMQPMSGDTMYIRFIHRTLRRYRTRAYYECL
jgi:hypothetical protein